MKNIKYWINIYQTIERFQTLGRVLVQVTCQNLEHMSRYVNVEWMMFYAGMWRMRYDSFLNLTVLSQTLKVCYSKIGQRVGKLQVYNR